MLGNQIPKKSMHLYNLLNIYTLFKGFLSGGSLVGGNVSIKNDENISSEQFKA